MVLHFIYDTTVLQYNIWCYWHCIYMTTTVLQYNKGYHWHCILYTTTTAFNNRVIDYLTKIEILAAGYIYCHLMYHLFKLIDFSAKKNKWICMQDIKLITGHLFPNRNEIFKSVTFCLILAFTISWSVKENQLLV